LRKNMTGAFFMSVDVRKGIELQIMVRTHHDERNH
jgi:hypothetical protein